MTVSVKYGYTVTSDMKGLDALQKRLQDLNQKTIQYGYFEDNVYSGEGRNNGQHTAQIAYLQEIGFPTKGVDAPPRPFFTQSLAKAKWMIRQAAPTVYTLAFQGKLEKSFVEMATWLKESVQETIDEQNFVANTERTKALKSPETRILVETGHMRDSVQAKIVNSDAYGNRKKEVNV